MKTLYKQIQAVKCNDELWFEKILELKDEEFIVDNVEYRLGGDLTNRKLWKIYLKYLEDVGSERVSICSFNFSAIIILLRRYLKP